MKKCQLFVIRLNDNLIFDNFISNIFHKPVPNKKCGIQIVDLWTLFSFGKDIPVQLV